LERALIATKEQKNLYDSPSTAKRQNPTDHGSELGLTGADMMILS
jgi:hypothetical protein